MTFFLKYDIIKVVREKKEDYPFTCVCGSSNFGVFKDHIICWDCGVLVKAKILFHPLDLKVKEVEHSSVAILERQNWF